MEDGAVGLSTGLIYLPRVFSRSNEIVELARAVATYDDIDATHIRHENAQIYAVLEEVFRVACEARLRAKVTQRRESRGKVQEVFLLWSRRAPQASTSRRSNISQVLVNERGGNQKWRTHRGHDCSARE
jgi:hypothetical protein